VIGIEPRTRASAQAAKASTIVTWLRGMSTARRAARRTRKTVRWCEGGESEEHPAPAAERDRLLANADEGIAATLKLVRASHTDAAGNIPRPRACLCL